MPDRNGTNGEGTERTAQDPNDQYAAIAATVDAGTGLIDERLREDRAIEVASATSDSETTDDDFEEEQERVEVDLDTAYEALRMSAREIVASEHICRVDEVSVLETMLHPGNLLELVVAVIREIDRYWTESNLVFIYGADAAEEETGAGEEDGLGLVRVILYALGRVRRYLDDEAPRKHPVPGLSPELAAKLTEAEADLTDVLRAWEATADANTERGLQ